MIRYMFELNIKGMMIIALWSILCSAAIVTIVMWTHDISTSESKAKIDKLVMLMECKDNACDRFKGQDAIELEKRLMTEIQETRKDCGC